VVIPAEAQKVARELTAQGEAAEIAEQGRAMARVLKMMAEVWEEAGDAAMDVFILQHIETIMDRVAEAARQVQIRKAAIIDGGDGESLPKFVSSFPRIVGSIFEEMRESVGLDISGALTGEHGGNGSLDLESVDPAAFREAIEHALEEGEAGEAESAERLLEQLSGEASDETREER
jgi:flotillin